MGTHPIFESDFDCLTDLRKNGRDSRISSTKGKFGIIKQTEETSGAECRKSEIV